MRPELQRPPAVPDTLTPGDQLLAAGLGISAAAGGLVWATGQLAGLAFGHTWLHVSPAEVAHLLWQLPHHLGDPATAWPAPAQRALPGPAGMYAAFTATTATATGAASGALRLWHRMSLGNPTAAGARTKRSAAGSATWATPGEQRRLRPLFETVATQLVQAAQEQAARAPDGKLDPRLLCALDEAGNVAALELLPEWATTGRGQGIQLLSVWHDQAQLQHRYGDRAATILNGHRAKLFLSGLADVGALELGSRLVGDQAVVETNYATDPTGRVSAAQATSWRPLVPLEELRRLRPGEGIVIYGHLRPTRITVRPHFTPREQRWRARLDRQAAQQRRWEQRHALRARERAARRAARWRQRVDRHLPGWARGREGAGRER